MEKKIIKKSITQGKHFLVLNRETSKLEIYTLTSVDSIINSYSLRADFDLSNYNCYEKEREMDCIFGRIDSPTPKGFFEIERKSKKGEEYISGYYQNLDKVKFFGYLVIFEDYFIHSDLYSENVTAERIENSESISKGDSGTSGCIRVKQKELEWLLDNIEVGSLIMM